MSEIRIGSPVRCTDAPCGSLARIVIDPASVSVAHLVVRPHRGAGRLVPFGYVTDTVDGVQLACPKTEFDSLLSDQDQELVADAGETFDNTTPPHSSGEVGLLSVYGEIAPTGITRPFPAEHTCRTNTFDRVPPGEEQLKPGEEVRAQDGVIGRVGGLTVDLSTHRISYLLVAAGHLWGKHQMKIPFDVVESVGISVRIGLTKQQIQELDTDS